MNKDIAIYELSEEVTDVPTLRLSRESINTVGTRMAVVGVGDTDAYEHKKRKTEKVPPKLKKADLELVSIEDCRIPYVPFGEDKFIKGDSMLCAQKDGRDR
jgi:hypothetical protein